MHNNILRRQISSWTVARMSLRSKKINRPHLQTILVYRARAGWKIKHIKEPDTCKSYCRADACDRFGVKTFLHVLCQHQWHPALLRGALGKNKIKPILRLGAWCKCIRIYSAGFISHQINLSLALYPPLIGRARHTCSDTCPVCTPPLFAGMLSFLILQIRQCVKQKRNYLFVAYSAVRASRTVILCIYYTISTL